jgi:hypothetical protein
MTERAPWTQEIKTLSRSIRQQSVWQRPGRSLLGLESYQEPGVVMAAALSCAQGFSVFSFCSTFGPWDIFQLHSAELLSLCPQSMQSQTTGIRDWPEPPWSPVLSTHGKRFRFAISWRDLAVSSRGQGGAWEPIKLTSPAWTMPALAKSPTQRIGVAQVSN